MSSPTTTQPAGAPRPIDYLIAGMPPPIVLAYGIGVDSTALLVCGESISSYAGGGFMRL